MKTESFLLLLSMAKFNCVGGYKKKNAKSCFELPGDSQKGSSLANKEGKMTNDKQAVQKSLDSSLDALSFPAGFKFGVASASYQVEGAWNVSDKSENIWDRFTHSYPERISDRSNGDVACDSYNLWERDIEMIQELGAHFYRFSLSWTRLIPNGFGSKVSEDGKNYYNKLIDALLEKGIEPIVTIYHWDLPQKIQELGGWTNPLIADWFGDYARVCYSLFADRVKTWLTLNETIVFCDLTYNNGIMAPGVVETEVAPYLACKNALLAHAKAYRIFDEEFRPKYGGKISLANQIIWVEAMSPEYEELAELARQNMGGRYSHAIYSKEGGWPPMLKEAFELKARKEGTRSKLPEFTQEEIEFIRGTYDYFGFNFYTSRLIRPAKEGEALNPWPLGDFPDFSAKMERHPDWDGAASSWFFVYPEGFRKQLLWIKEQYGDIPILITENGYATTGGLDDEVRVNYYRDHLKQVLLAIKEDRVNVMGYTAWTLMDNFEWMDGYRSQFGLYQVDFNSPKRTRTPRSSAYFYKEIIKNHSLDVQVPTRTDN